MSWKDLLGKPTDFVELPWLGGRSLRSRNQSWTIEGRSPDEHGWHSFRIIGRRAIYRGGKTDPKPEILTNIVKGYLVGDCLVEDHVVVDPNPATIADHVKKVHLLDEGLDRFVRVSAGVVFDDGPLVFRSAEMPLGPEGDVLDAFLARRETISNIKGVVPALDAAFQIEVWRRNEIERHRAELVAQRAEEERLAKIHEAVGTAVGRRKLAEVDFGEAARSALAISGAVYLDHRKLVGHEMAVRFSFHDRRFECTCDDKTLRIIDSGVCLRNERTGERGDDRFTLESLPLVILEAIQTHRLVVFRHVDDVYNRFEDELDD